jgi:hypothetical protein
MALTEQQRAASQALAAQEAEQAPRLAPDQVERLRRLLRPPRPTAAPSQPEAAP